MIPNRTHLKRRSDTLRQLRDFFDGRGFLEVQPPCLSRDCIVDPYIDPLTIGGRDLGVASVPVVDQYYLQTSPESAMKRLVCAGAPSIYGIGPVFRAGERGPMHNPEFTMLEWYEIGGDARSAIEMLGELAMTCLNQDQYQVVTYRDAFLQSVGIDPLTETTTNILDAVHQHDESLAESLASDRDGLLDALMDLEVIKTLGRDVPTVLTEYPISQAALARQSPDDPRVALRFELFASGVELANGYDELLDADTLRQRTLRNNEKRLESRRPALPSETELCRAMDNGMPSCSGVALGVDRLLMVQVGAHSIDEVIPFPIEIA